MTRNAVTTLVLSAIVLSPVAAAAQVVFDNGGYSGPQGGAFNAGWLTMVEDFTLTADTTVTGLTWAQHDSADSVYTNTVFRVYGALPTSSSTPLFSTTLVATRTANSTPLSLFGLQGFDYSYDGLAWHLPAGTYYFSLHMVGSSGLFTWDQTLGTAQTIPGRWQYETATMTPVSALANENSAFRINGTVGVVPEPETGLLLFAGVVALAALRHRRRFPAGACF